MSHARYALHGDKDVARAVRIDIVRHQDIAQVAGIAIATHIVARGGLPADPCMLTLEGVLRAPVIGMVACTVDIEAVATGRIEP